MTNQERELRNKQLVEALFHQDTEKSLEAIEQIRDLNEVEFLYPLLQLIKHTKNQKIERKAKSVFFDLKNNAAAKFIVENIKLESDAAIKQFLVSACWNNGLDYSAYLDVFVALFIDDIFEISFDAFTVIEDMTGFAERNVIMDQVLKLRKVRGQIASDRVKLLDELIIILENLL
jgi:hypothetical protein